NDLLALLDNPCVRRKANLEPDRLEAVAEFLASAGFQEGWEARDPEDPATGGSCLADAIGRTLLALALDPEDPVLEGAAFADATFPWPGGGARTLLERAETSRLLEWLEGLRAHTLPLRDGKSRTWEQ